jgi:hypothetical protein
MSESVGADFETCHIVFWRGYFKCAFYAVPEAGEPLGSRSFRSRDRTPAQSGEALEAHRELVERLEDDGWEPFAREREWYALTFRRRRWSPVDAFLAEEAPPPVTAVEAHRAQTIPEPEAEPEPAPAQEETPVPRAAAHRSQGQLALLLSTAALIVLAVVLGLTVFSTSSAQGKTHPAVRSAKPQTQHRTPAAGLLSASRRPATPSPTRIVVTGSRGESWVEARTGSATGKSLYAGVVAQGQTVRITAPVVWVTFGAAGNLDLRVNGRSPVPGTFRGTITAVIAHGRVRSS